MSVSKTINEAIVTNEANLNTFTLPFSFENPNPNPKYKLPAIAVKWDRIVSLKYVPFKKVIGKRPVTYMTVAPRGEGKSALGEVISIRYRKIIDVLGADDGESLCWLRPCFLEWFEGRYGRKPKILLLIGQNMRVESKENFEALTIEDIDLKTVQKYDIITTTQYFYKWYCIKGDDTEYYDTIGKLINIIGMRRSFSSSKREAWALLARESSDWAYARTKVTANAEENKALLLKDARKFRHKGISFLCDILRITNQDKEIRDLAEYTIMKGLGVDGLPNRWRWMYRYWDPNNFTACKVNHFSILTIKGDLGHGQFEKPFFHKEEHDDLFKECGIFYEVIRTEGDTEQQLDAPNSRAFEHAKRIRLVNEGNSYAEVAKHCNVSSRSTIAQDVKSHNESISNLTYCELCKRAKCELSESIISARSGR